jgi:ornithine carbamoyltransferase
MPVKQQPIRIHTLAHSARHRSMHLPLPTPPRAADESATGMPAPIPDTAVLLAYARMLQRETQSGSRQPWLRGKNIGLFGAAGDGAEATLFRRAATELGAKVAQVHPFPDGPPATAEVELTARLIGRLYDAVDWPCAPADLLEQMRSAAGIPIYDGLAAAGHPTARLAGLLGIETPIADRRRFVVQAVLLATVI